MSVDLGKCSFVLFVLLREAFNIFWVSFELILTSLCPPLEAGGGATSDVYFSIKIPKISLERFRDFLILENAIF